MKTKSQTEGQPQVATSAVVCAERPTTLIRVVMIKPFTRRAIALWHPIGSHTRSSPVRNHRNGRKRAWTFRTKRSHTDKTLPTEGAAQDS